MSSLFYIYVSRNNCSISKPFICGCTWIRDDGLAVTPGNNNVYITLNYSPLAGNLAYSLVIPNLEEVEQSIKKMKENKQYDEVLQILHKLDVYTRKEKLDSINGLS